jgi:MFS family permease
MYAPQPAIMTEMFPTRMRYSGVSLGYQVTSLAAGSWAPLIGTALLREYDSWLPIAFYILGSAAISLVAALLLRETRGASLHALDETDRNRAAA